MSHTDFIAKSASENSVNFLFPDVVLYPYKRTIRPYMEYCCHGWAGAPCSHLDILGKSQKQVCRTVDPTLAVSLEPLGYRRNVVSWSVFYRYSFGRFPAELAELAPLPYSWGRSSRCSDGMHDFPVTISRYYKDVFVNSFFPRTVIHRISFPAECFSLTYDLNSFKARADKHLLFLGSF